MAKGAGQTSVHSGGSRLTGIDVARGVAVLLMIQTHAYDGWVDVRERASPAFQLTRTLGTLPLPMFLLLAGLGLALRSESAAARGISPKKTRLEVAKSALEIVLAGYALSLAYGLVDGASGPGWWLRADILQAIGLSILCVGLLGIGSRMRLAAVALALTVLPVAVCPWLTGLGHNLSGPLRYLAGLLIEVPGVSPMPLVPLLAFCAFGAGVGLWLAPHGRDAISRSKLVTLLGVGALLMVLGVMSSDFARKRGITIARGDWSILLNVIDLVGRALSCIALSALGTPWLRASLERVLVACGRHSLFVYALHLPFCYGRLARPIKRSLSMPIASLLVFTLLLFCAWAAWWLEKAHMRRKAVILPA